MKLKKIASLALAGVMAVSMLAGCKGNDSSTGNQGTVVVPTTSDIVTALNNGQTSGNEVKVTFTAANSSIVDALQSAIKYNGSMNATQLQTQVLSFVGGSVAGWNDTSLFNTTNGFYGDDCTESHRLAFEDMADPRSGESLSKVPSVTLVKAYAVQKALSKEAAIASFVNDMDKAIANLKADDVVPVGTKEKVGNEYWLNTTQPKYHTYGYTGSVAMASETHADGTTDYYFVMAVTQTVTEKTVEK